MTGFSILFLIASWGFTKLFGSSGFILANCCNMFARILHSVIYIKNRYAKSPWKPLRGLKPTKYFFICLCLTLVITKTTEVS